MTTLMRLTLVAQRVEDRIVTSSLPGRVAAEIRAELGRKRLSQAELARRLGKTEMYVSRRLADGTSLDLGDVLDIAGLLGVPPAVLLTTTDPAEIAAGFVSTELRLHLADLAAALGVPVDALIAPSERAA